MSVELTESQVDFKGLVFDFNKGDEEFTEAEQANMQAFLDNPSHGNLSGLTESVGLADPEESTATEADRGFFYWSQARDTHNANGRPESSDFPTTPEGQNEFLIAETEYNKTRQFIMQALEMYYQNDAKTIQMYSDNGRGMAV